MRLDRRTLLTATTAAPAVLVATSPAATFARPHGSGQDAQVVLDWQRILLSTVYTVGLTPIPVGVPILGFTSMAMYRAARQSVRAEQTAAVAGAAHDVLLHYYPAAATALGVELRASLATVRDPAAREAGLRAGRRVAADLLASRVGDGYLDTSIHYVLPPGPGVWQPTAPSTDMLAAWLGSLRPLVLSAPVEVGGPDPLTSSAYAEDYDEVRRLGSATSTERSGEQTATAVFFNSNSATMVTDALVRHLDRGGPGLGATARIFAAMHAAMTDAVIRCWQLKRDVGFWRPNQAVAGAGTDGNPATGPEAGWAPLLPTPPYSDYVSGHSCATGPAVEIVRRLLGERTPLELVSVNSPRPRTYPTLRALEADAFGARIWGGLHFRRAMIDGYAIAHTTARQVLREIG